VAGSQAASFWTIIRPATPSHPKEGKVTLSTEDLIDKALALSRDVEDNFLELGKCLRQLMDRDPNLFQQIVQKTNLGRRKAYYLVEVSRIFDPLPVPRSRLRKIGWTKLQLIAKHITADNLDELLQLAENASAKRLEAAMRGEKSLGNAHCVLMYFSPKDYADLEDTLVKHGGVRSGRGIQNKEEALLRMVHAMKKQPKGD
jgi:hypothetical protein